MLDLDKILAPNAIVPVDVNTTSQLVEAIRRLRDELDTRAREDAAQQAAALYYIAAVANKCGTDGVLHLTAEDMKAAESLILERADDPDGGVMIRVSQEQQPAIVEWKPVLAKAERPIVLVDPALGESH